MQLSLSRFPDHPSRSKLRGIHLKINLNVIGASNTNNTISISEKSETKYITDLKFSDYFSDDNSNWKLFPDDDDCERYIDDGKLIFNKISDYDDFLCYCALDGYTPPENIIVEFNATIERNKYEGIIGIIFRKVDYDNYYIFGIRSEGDYAFAKNENDELLEIIPWTNSPFIKKGTETNSIRIKCEGDTFTFYINGHEIDSCVDSSFADGGISLVAGVGDNDLNKNKFSFDNFKIWSISY